VSTAFFRSGGTFSLREISAWLRFASPALRCQRALGSCRWLPLRMAPPFQFKALRTPVPSLFISLSPSPFKSMKDDPIKKLHAGPPICRNRGPRLPRLRVNDIACCFLLAVRSPWNLHLVDILVVVQRADQACGPAASAGSRNGLFRSSFTHRLVGSPSWGAENL